MNDSTTSLDRLHDLALPPDVPWWPPAPGWYVVLGCLIAIGIFLLTRWVSRYRANAYRRAALRELASLGEAAAVAELLRRTALAVAPRSTITQKTGAAWLEWLARQSPEPLSETVREQLMTGVYGRPVADPDLTALREFAARWITSHRQPMITDGPPGC